MDENKLSDVPVNYFECTHRSIDPSETIKNIESKLKIAGITRVTDITGLDRVGIPVFSAIRPTAEEGAVSIYAGKGANPTQAKASAMMEGYERYSAEKQDIDNKRMIIGTYHDGLVGDKPAIDPETLILPSDIKYDNLEWISSYNLCDNKEYYIPANTVFHPYIPTDNNCGYLFNSNTNGLASGNIKEEAILHGILEIIERDAWSLFESHKIQPAEIQVTENDNTIIQDLINKFNAVDVDIKLLDLTADIPISTVAAVSDDTRLKDPALLTLGVGTHLKPDIAILRALTEVAQSRATQIHGTREDTSRAVFMRQTGYERMKRINKHYFSKNDTQITIPELKDLSSDSFKKDIETCLQELNKIGIHNCLYTNLTREELEISVVRVTIPELELYSLDPTRKGQRIKKIRRELREKGLIR